VLLESSSLSIETALRDAPAAEQINHQYDQRNYQQQVNQAARDMEAKTQQPQNQKHNENCPKHIDLLFLI
jgi:hypothetical protein